MTDVLTSAQTGTGDPAAGAGTPAQPGGADVDFSRMVRCLAGRVLAGLPKGSGVEMCDLVQAGNLGLLQAVRSFSPENGAPLAGYAKFRIRGEMLDTVRRNRGRGESAGAGWRASRRPDSAEDSNILEEKLPAPYEHSPLGLLATRERAAILGQEVNKLPPRYRAVVRMRYSREFSLREIGAALQVNESRACQIHRCAIERLRRALWNRGVRGLSHVI